MNGEIYDYTAYILRWTTDLNQFFYMEVYFYFKGIEKSS